MNHVRYGFSLVRKRRLAMDLKQVHTRISNVCDELSRAYPEPDNQIRMLLGQLEKASVHLGEAKNFAKGNLVTCDSQARDALGAGSEEEDGHSFR